MNDAKANAAIAEINEKLELIDSIFDEGDLNEEAFKTLSKVYANGVILRAQFQAAKTTGEMK